MRHSPLVAGLKGLNPVARQARDATNDPRKAPGIRFADFGGAAWSLDLDVVQHLGGDIAEHLDMRLEGSRHDNVKRLVGVSFLSAMVQTLECVPVLPHDAAVAHPPDAYAPAEASGGMVHLQQAAPIDMSEEGPHADDESENQLKEFEMSANSAAQAPAIQDLHGLWDAAAATAADLDLDSPLF